MATQEQAQQAEQALIELINQLAVDENLGFQTEEMLEFAIVKGQTIARFKGDDGETYQFFKKGKEYEFRQETEG